MQRNPQQAEGAFSRLALEAHQGREKLWKREPGWVRHADVRIRAKPLEFNVTSSCKNSWQLRAWKERADVHIHLELQINHLETKNNVMNNIFRAVIENWLAGLVTLIRVKQNYLHEHSLSKRNRWDLLGVRDSLTPTKHKDVWNTIEGYPGQVVQNLRYKTSHRGLAQKHTSS